MTTDIHATNIHPTSKHAWLIGGAVAALLLTGCTGGAPEQQTGQAASSSAPAAAPGMGTPDVAHNDADAMFAQHMLPHHRQAVEMSDMLLAKKDVNPQVVALARQIKAAQGPEITQLQGWLEKWGIPSIPSMPPMPADGRGGAPMAGMMSEEDMAALQNASGPDAGRIFLTQMISHHEGAISMAQQEVDEGEFPGAVEMATKIVTTQKREIDTMRGLLASM